MKKLIATVLASALFAAGCAPDDRAAVETGSASEPQTYPIKQNYNCESGQVVKVSYSSVDTATVQYQGKTREMRVAVSGSGARYVGNGMEWWTKGSGPGSEGTLFRHQPDATTGPIIDSCVAN